MIILIYFIIYFIIIHLDNITGNAQYENMREKVKVYKRNSECERNSESTRKFDISKQVGYMKNIREKLSSYTCNQNICPIMRERLQKHKLEHHVKNRNGSKDQNDATNEDSLQLEDDLIVSPLRNLYMEDNERNSYQPTEPKIIDRKNAAVETIYVNDDATQTGPTPLRNSATIEILTPNINFYREYIRNEINDWIQSIPMYQNADTKTKERILNELLEIITKLYVDVHNETYDYRLKLAINNCLGNLPLLMTDTKHENDVIKYDLTHNLFNSIKELNHKLLNNQNNVNTRSKDSIDVEISEWLTGIELEDANVNKEDTAISLQIRLRPLLDVPTNTTNNKLKIKGEIIGVLDNLPLHLKNSKNKFIHLNRFAEDLANRLISIQCRRRKQKYQNNLQINEQRQCNIYLLQSNSHAFKYKLHKRLNDCLELFHIEDDSLASIIIDSLLDNIDIIQSGHINIVEKEITELVYNTCNFTESQSAVVADYILNNIKDIINMSEVAKCKIRPQHSGIISVYTSEKFDPITSTPKRSKKNKDHLKFPKDERNYNEKVIELVRSWVKALPDSKKILDEKEYKNTAITDFAGTIVDTMKLSQLTKDAKKEEEHIQYVTYIWLVKFNLFEKIADVKSLVKDFYKKLRLIPVPDLTKPTSGSRHTAKKIEFIEKSHPSMVYFPEKLDLIEDQISIWMNEQPSAIYISSDKQKHNKMIHEVAEKLKKQFKDKKSTKEIKTTVSKFLGNVVKSQTDVNELSESLSERIIKLPTEEYLDTERKAQRAFTSHLKEHVNEDDEPIYEDANKTIIEVVSKYIQHFYDIEDSVARGAFEHLLSKAIIYNDAASRQKIYDKLSKDKPDPYLDKELEYISMISDWLKNIPVVSAFNTAGNMQRANFINKLASEMRAFAEAIKKHPDWNHENDFKTIITCYINELPLQENQEQNIPYMVNQLGNRFFGTSLKDENFQSESVIDEYNLGDFIEDYILTKAQSIADDEVKLDAWLARILKEVRNIAREDPRALTKTNLYHRLEKLPIPENEYTNMFELELAYVKEISEWLKNLPLLPINDDNDELARIDMISDLADKLVERKYKKNTNSDKSDIEKEIVDYITSWILKLPLNANREVIIPILVKQLLNRIDNSDKKEEDVDQNSVKQDVKKPDSTKKSGLLKKDSIKKSASYTKKPSSKVNQVSTNSDPGKIVVDAIENWIENLPIDADSKDYAKTAKSIKYDFAKRLFKKIGEINSDPKIFDDYDLYREIINDEVEAQLEAITSGNKVEKNKKDKLKSDLINAILEARYKMKQKSSCNEYINRLLNTIDAYLLNSVDNQNYDPGFELYRINLVNLFIVTNFDHIDDDFKLPYLNKISNEIDKYFTYAIRQNPRLLNKEQLSNELFSVLFKVPMPHKEAFQDEIERIKTKIVVDEWYEELPLEKYDYSLYELLERYKILAAFAQSIQKLEKEETLSENILREIKKWMLKFSSEGDYWCKFDFYANKLLNKLNATKEERKYSCTNTEGTKNKSSLGENRITSPKPRLKIENTKSFNNSPCCQAAAIENKNPTELILHMIEIWFDNLPVLLNDGAKKILKTNVVTKLMLKINEFNTNPSVLYDDFTYYSLIHQELNEVLTHLPLPCDFASISDHKKIEFLSAMENIKPLIEVEKARQDYKNKLRDTIDSVLAPPQENNGEKSEMFNYLKDELVDEFVQYYYNKDDERGRKLYKNKVHGTILKYVQDMLNKQENIDPLILRNRLLCELEKIPITSAAILKHDVEEIKMKEEVDAFLNENSIKPKNKDQEQIKINLAKKLFEIERTGHTCDNVKKMKAEIFKNTRKMGHELSSDRVDAFLNRLKETEPLRKALPVENESGNQIENRNDQLLRQNEYPSEILHQGDKYVNIKRQTSLPPRLSSNQISFESNNFYNTPIMGIEHLVKEADRRWKETCERYSNRPIHSSSEIDKHRTGVPYPEVGTSSKQIGMQQFTSLPQTYQNVEQPLFSQGTPLRDQHFYTKPIDRKGFERRVLPTAVPNHVVRKLQFDTLSNTQQSIPAVAQGVNTSCDHCGQPSPLKASPDPDPSNREADSFRQSVQNSIIGLKGKGKLEVDQTSRPISNQLTGTPTTATTEKSQTPVENIKNIGLPNIPCGTPEQMQSVSEFGKELHAPLSMADTNQTPISRRPGRNKITISNEHIKENLVKGIPCEPEPGMQPIGISSDKNDPEPYKEILSPRALIPSKQGRCLRQYLRRKLIDGKEVPPGSDEMDNQNFAAGICKCGRRGPRKRRYCEDNFGMCFKRLPRCFYY